MKSMLKNLLRAAWRGLSPIYRPLFRKLDDHVNRLVHQALTTELEARLVPTLTAALETTTRTVERVDDLIARTDRSTAETDQALDVLLGELVRVRQQVEGLQRLIQPVGDGSGLEPGSLDGLAFDDRDEACTPYPADPAEERAQVR